MRDATKCSTNPGPLDVGKTADKCSVLESVWLTVLAIVLVALYFPLNYADSSVVILTGPIDSIIPIVPALSLPYLAFLPVFALVFVYALVSGRGFVRLALAVIIVCACSDLIYFLAQTHVPRPRIAAQGLFGQLLGYVYGHDRPFNDFPSEHAAFATLLALYVWSLGMKYWRVVVGFCALVMLATVMIKQHSLLGALSGVAVALIAWCSASTLLGRSRGVWACRDWHLGCRGKDGGANADG